MTFDLQAARDLREEASFHVAFGAAHPTLLAMTETLEAAYDPASTVTADEIRSAVVAAAMADARVYQLAVDSLTE